MRVVIVTHRVVRSDGQGRVNYEIARHLAAHGVPVLLIAGEVTRELLEDGRIRWSKVSHGPLPGALLRNLWFAAGSSRVLRELRTAGDFVVVNGAATMAASDINVAHFVHGGWAGSPHYNPGRGFRGLYQRLYTRLNARLERRAFRSARRLVAVSHKVADELVAVGCRRDRIEIIHNGVDTDEFRPGAGDRAGLGLPDCVPLVLFAGGLGTRRKNLETALRALVRTSSVHLAVAGGGEPEHYRRLANELGLSNRVHFLGLRFDMADIMRGCDFLLFPSRYEPFGLVILEAMACGLPVITSASAGAAEIMEEGCGIVIADPNDVDALATAMKAVMADLTGGREMAAKARNIAERNDWSVAGEKYLALCRRIAMERDA